jgi:hypothetical protein
MFTPAVWTRAAAITATVTSINAYSAMVWPRELAISLKILFRRLIDSPPRVVVFSEMVLLEGGFDPPAKRNFQMTVQAILFITGSYPRYPATW